MKHFLFLCLLLIARSALAVNLPCPQTTTSFQGGTAVFFTLSCIPTRSSAISPASVWIDCTGSADTATLPGANNTFQDVGYSINFGDTLGSGTRTWSYGAGAPHNSSNVVTGPGIFKMNSGVGPVAAHVYITEGRDTKYTITVTGSDGVSPSVSCGIGFTAFDPGGANGYTTKICQANGVLPVAGSGGCPAGFTGSNSASVTANTSGAMSNKLVLLRCGDTFTSNISVASGSTKGGIGAYGSCPNSSPTAPNGRPIVGSINVSNNVSDFRIVDLDQEGTGVAAGGYAFQITTLANTVATDITLLNIYENNWAQNIYWTAGKRIAYVNSHAGDSTTSIQTNFPNYGENNCLNGGGSANDTYLCGGVGFIDITYSYALLGDYFGGGTSQETVRSSACRFCVLTDSDYLNAGSSKAVLKFHSGNTFDSKPGWIGQYTEDFVICRNYFGGTSGWLVEISPQNSSYDERIRNGLVCSNIFHPSGSTTHLELDANNVTVIDNMCLVGGECIGAGKRGNAWGSFTTGTSIQSCTDPATPSTCTGNTGAPVDTSEPQMNEFYNNSSSGASNTVAFDSGFGGGRAGNNSWAKNNLAFGGTTVSNGGSNNIVTNNTSNTALNPLFVDASGTMNTTPDWQPTANFGGATSVPNFYDALGTLWNNVYSLGAVHP